MAETAQSKLTIMTEVAQHDTTSDKIPDVHNNGLDSSVDAAHLCEATGYTFTKISLAAKSA